ncbi:aspartate kinase [Haladaptatus sp. T7]|uniref:amino acid kinase family protein n=1 Tax=Haladaptatus sp. T7 TaxID=2029368 RepID=UPI0021A25A8D|nr:aspartate kinase [Haladaptatus sp. T7]GKZ12396.1 aspartate kinase [Haladaptatus sp. T7]
MKLVVKFGGTSLANRRRIDRATKTVAGLVEAGHEVVVVASAMGNTTDELLNDVAPDSSNLDRAEVVSMGERTSVRMLKSHLTAAGMDATFVEPGDDDWPIFVRPDDENSIDIERTKRGVERLSERLDGCVPVVTGFLAEDDEGNVRTLNRGGSDTTATLLGDVMNADKVVLVTDVRGIRTGDPKAVDGTKRIDEISVGEVRDLATCSAEVVAPAALEYKTETTELSVVHYEHDDVLADGTDIYGEFETVLNVRDVPFAGITVSKTVSRSGSRVDGPLVETLSTAGIAIKNAFADMDSVTCYVRRDDLHDAVESVHRLVTEHDGFSSVSTRETVAVVHVVDGERGAAFDTVRRFAISLLDSSIEIFDAEIGTNSMTVYLDWDDRHHVEDLLQSARMRG